VWLGAISQEGPISSPALCIYRVYNRHTLDGSRIEYRPQGCHDNGGGEADQERSVHFEFICGNVAMTIRNDMHDDIRAKLKSRPACCHARQNLHTEFY